MPLAGSCRGCIVFKATNVLLERLRLGPAGSSNFLPARNCATILIVVTQETLVSRKRGPAPTGKGIPVVVRLQPDQLAALDAWRDEQAPVPTRPEAVRRLIAAFLPA